MRPVSWLVMCMPRAATSGASELVLERGGGVAVLAVVIASEAWSRGPRTEEVTVQRGTPMPLSLCTVNLAGGPRAPVTSALVEPSGHRIRLVGSVEPVADGTSPSASEEGGTMYESESDRPDRWKLVARIIITAIEPLVIVVINHIWH